MTFRPSFALACLRQGIVVDVYEQATAFREIGNGLALQPNAARLINDQLGLKDEVRYARSRALIALMVKHSLLGLAPALWGKHTWPTQIIELERLSQHCNHLELFTNDRIESHVRKCLTS